MEYLRYIYIYIIIIIIIWIMLYLYIYICDNMYLWHCWPYSKKLVRGQERWSVSPRFRWVIPCIPGSLTGSTKPCDQTAAKLLSWFYDVNCLHIYILIIICPFYLRIISSCFTSDYIDICICIIYMYSANLRYPANNYINSLLVSR